MIIGLFATQMFILDFVSLLQGESGVNKVLEMIRSEFSITMALAGKSILENKNHQFE